MLKGGMTMTRIETYLFVIKGKGNSFYNIGVSNDSGILGAFDNLPFKIRLFEVLETDQAQLVKDYLHQCFAQFKTSGDWFDLSSKQAEKLKLMLDDPDNLISMTEEHKSPRTFYLPHFLWDKLDKFSRKTKSLAASGKDLGQPSWGVLLERIVKSPKILWMIEQELNDHSDLSTPKQYQEAVIVRPDDVVTETIAWLNVDSDKISVSFPEKREDFKRLSKDFGLRWDGEAQSRSVGRRAGDSADRAAELGHKLLSSGFSVIFPDERIQEMAIAGEYEPECRRWVQVRNKGPYKDWFVLSWAYAEDCYEAAKKISGSRYDKPNVVVPPEQFAEVIDFAKIHKFCFSQAALALVVQAKAMLDSAMLVSIEQREDQDYPLNLPELDWEDDDLEDDINFDASPNTTT